MKPFRIQILREGILDESFFKTYIQKMFPYKEIDIKKTVERKSISYGELKISFRTTLNSQFASETDLILAAFDNDRAPEHPGGRTYAPPISTTERARYPELQEIHNQYPENIRKKTVLAVPVEMIESWILLILDPDLQEDDVPPFSKAIDPSAITYFGNNPPPQCKDMVRKFEKEHSCFMHQYINKHFQLSHFDSLKGKSASFRLFSDSFQAACKNISV